MSGGSSNVRIWVGALIVGHIRVCAETWSEVSLVCAGLQDQHRAWKAIAGQQPVSRGVCHQRQ